MKYFLTEDSEQFCAYKSFYVFCKGIHIDAGFADEDFIDNFEENLYFRMYNTLVSVLDLPYFDAEGWDEAHNR